MSLTREKYQAYCDILKEELRLAMGCTEPIAIAYSASVARGYMEQEPTSITINLSGNIIKNTKSVVVPATGGMHGIPAAVIAGTVANKPELVLEVLSALSSEDIPKMQAMMENCPVEVKELDTTHIFEIVLVMENDKEEVQVRLLDRHTNLVYVEKNGQVLLRNEQEEEDGGIKTDRTLLNVEDIVTFADEVEIEDVRELLERQIECNMAIAERGMQGDFGIGIGRAILETYADSTYTKMRAYAAAASEARMDGCDMPVIITSGSGNQGITSTVPVIVFARENGIPEERMHRALVFSALLTIYQKEYIGKLSAFCGAVSAACAAGAAITYIKGGTLTQIKDTVDNTLADVPGIICDGAKASCAVKISSALDAALFAHSLAMKGKVYASNTGILQDDTGETISCVGHIGRVGMQPTDQEIVKIMIQG